MKKIVLSLIGLVILTGCGNKEISLDASKFKEEYEAVNSNAIAMDISTNNPIKYASFEEVMNIFTNGTGVVYFGFPTCPWCRNMIPVLFDSAKESKVDTVYYFNPSSMRSDDNEDYQKLLKVLENYLEADEEGNKKLYVPDVYFVKDGKIVGHHLGTVSSQKDPRVALDKEQVAELKTIFNDLFNKIK